MDRILQAQLEDVKRTFRKYLSAFLSSNSFDGGELLSGKGEYGIDAFFHDLKQK